MCNGPFWRVSAWAVHHDVRPSEAEACETYTDMGAGAGANRGSLQAGGQGGSDPLSIFLPPSIRFFMVPFGGHLPTLPSF